MRRNTLPRPGAASRDTRQARAAGRTATWLLLTLLLAAVPGRLAAAEPPALPAPAGEVAAADTLAEAALRADVDAYRRDLAYRLREPMAAALDVTPALTAWFAAQALAADAAREDVPTLKRELAAYRAGMEALKGELPALPALPWPANPTGVKLQDVEPLAIPDALWQMVELEKVPGVETRIVRFTVGEVRQYGVVLQPAAPGQYPLILYMHGAAFGVPSYSLPWLARLAARGYVVIAPALRGEDLFATPRYLNFNKDYKSDGAIENFAGEVDDALGMVAGARQLPNVQPGKFGIVGHSFGAGIGLLVAARSPDAACVVSYDAWLVNPFRYYWDRLREGPNNWLSWEDYTKQPVPAQLAGLRQRSLVHHADQVQAPLLLFIGGAYNGSVFHESHADLVARLKQLHKTVVYDIVPGGDHNFVLYYTSEPARYAYGEQLKWLDKYLPAVPPPAAKP